MGAIRIRETTRRDRDAIGGLYPRAFPEEEAPVVARCALGLQDDDDPGIVGLAAEIDDALVGHVVFSPVVIAGEPGWHGAILAPLAVEPAVQRRGIGSALVGSGIERVSARGAHAVFVYGDPAYYGRFGFDAEAARGYLPPYPLAYPFGWQAIVLDGTPPRAPAGTLSCATALCDPALW